MQKKAVSVLFTYKYGSIRLYKVEAIFGFGGDRLMEAMNRSVPIMYFSIFVAELKSQNITNSG